MNEKLDIGVIGLADIGAVNARALSGLGENIATLCDIDSAIFEKRSAAYPQARWCARWRVGAAASAPVT